MSFKNYGLSKFATDIFHLFFIILLLYIIIYIYFSCFIYIYCFIFHSWYWSNIHFQPFFSSIMHITIKMLLPFYLFIIGFTFFFECACALAYWLVCLIEFMIFIRLWVTTKTKQYDVILKTFFIYNFRKCVDKVYWHRLLKSDVSCI